MCSFRKLLLEKLAIMDEAEKSAFPINLCYSSLMMSSDSGYLLLTLNEKTYLSPEPGDME